MGNKRQHPRLDKDRNSNRLDNDIRRNAGNAHPQNSGHDHDKETGKVHMIILQKRQNKVAYVESHGCQCDCTDNDADDDAAHPYGNGAPRPLNNSGNNLISCHSRFFTKPACRHSDENRNNCCIKRRESRKHQPDKAHQGKDKMSLLFYHRQCIGNIFPGDSRKSEPLRFKMNRQKQTDIVEQRRCDSCQCHIGVGQV